MTFSGRGFPQILMRFAVLDKNSSFWSNFRKTFLPRVKETTDKNARSMARKAHPRQTAPTAPPPPIGSEMFLIKEKTCSTSTRHVGSAITD